MNFSSTQLIKSRCFPTIEDFKDLFKLQLREKSLDFVPAH